MELPAKRKGSSNSIGVKFPDGTVHTGVPLRVPAPFASMPLCEAAKIEKCLANKSSKELTATKVQTYYTVYFYAVSKRREYKYKTLAILAAGELHTALGKSPSYYSRILKEMCDIGLLKKEGHNRHFGTTYSFPLY